MNSFEWSQGGLELLSKIHQFVYANDGGDRLIKTIEKEWEDFPHFFYSPKKKPERKTNIRRWRPTHEALVIDLFEGGMKPIKIAVVMGRSRQSIVQVIYRLRKQGRIKKYEPGGY